MYGHQKSGMGVSFTSQLVAWLTKFASRTQISISWTLFWSIAVIRSCKVSSFKGTVSKPIPSFVVGMIFTAIAKFVCQVVWFAV